MIELPAFPAENLEGAQTTDHVEEPGSEPLESLPLAVLHSLGGPADQDHEHGNEREHHEDRDSARAVLRESDDDQERSRDSGQEQLGQEASEVIVESVKSGRYHRGHARALATSEPVWTTLGEHVKHAGTQLALDRGGASARGDLE